MKWAWKGAQERWVKISRGFFNCALIYCVTRLALPRECFFGQATDELLLSFFSFSESLDDHSMNVLSGGVGELLQKLREFHGEALVFEVTDLRCSW